MRINCPHCDADITPEASLAGQVVGCPQCGGQFQMPGAQIMAVPPLPAQFDGFEPAPIDRQPLYVQINTPAGPRGEPRLKAQGWFTR